jgi:hypothetical protein
MASKEDGAKVDAVEYEAAGIKVDVRLNKKVGTFSAEWGDKRWTNADLTTQAGDQAVPQGQHHRRVVPDYRCGSDRWKPLQWQGRRAGLAWRLTASIGDGRRSTSAG